MAILVLILSQGTDSSPHLQPLSQSLDRRPIATPRPKDPRLWRNVSRLESFHLQFWQRSQRSRHQIRPQGRPNTTTQRRKTRNHKLQQLLSRPHNGQSKRDTKPKISKTICTNGARIQIRHIQRRNHHPRPHQRQSLRRHSRAHPRRRRRQRRLTLVPPSAPKPLQ